MKGRRIFHSRHAVCVLREIDLSFEKSTAWSEYFNPSRISGEDLLWPVTAFAWLTGRAAAFSVPLVIVRTEISLWL